MLTVVWHMQNSNTFTNAIFIGVLLIRILKRLWSIHRADYFKYLKQNVKCQYTHTNTLACCIRVCVCVNEFANTLTYNNATADEATGCFHFIVQHQTKSYTTKQSKTRIFLCLTFANEDSSIFSKVLRNHS